MKFLKRINIFLYKPKVFCIGMNKTGTTTMLKTFKKLNFRTAPQIKQEQVIGDINSNMEYRKIKKLPIKSQNNIKKSVFVFVRPNYNKFNIFRIYFYLRNYFKKN